MVGGGWGVAEARNVCCHVPQLVLASAELTNPASNQPAEPPFNQPHQPAQPIIHHPSSTKPSDRCEPQSSSTPPPPASAPFDAAPAAPEVLAGKCEVFAAGLSTCRGRRRQPFSSAAGKCVPFSGAQTFGGHGPACLSGVSACCKSLPPHAARVPQSPRDAGWTAVAAQVTSSTRWCRALRDGGDELYEMEETSSRSGAVAGRGGARSAFGPKGEELYEVR